MAGITIARSTYGRSSRKALLPFILLFFCTMFAAFYPITSSFADEAEEQFELEAEKLTYDSESGIATAEGNVIASSGAMRIFAPAAVYDTREGLITAHAEENGSIILKTEDSTLEGESVQYNVNTGEGTLTKSSGKADAVFFNGGDIVIMPFEEAVSRKLVSGSIPPRRRSENVLFWSNVSASTCDFDEPHYRMVSKKVTIFPNKRAVMKKPKVYLEKRMVFQYPFDYVVPLNELEKSSPLMPSITYDSDKGLGLASKGLFTWDSGQIEIEAAYWTDEIWETELAIRQSLGGDFTAFAESKRLYNKDDGKTMWRPSWGVIYANSGWSVKLHEVQRELLKVEKRLGEEIRYNLWRSPELDVRTPWFYVAPRHFVNFRGIWGKYEDDYSTKDATRLAGNASLYGEPAPVDWRVTPFYKLSHWYLHYNDYSDSQKITDFTGGIRWSIGELQLSSAYIRRWVSGSSPLRWDRYYDRENFYQQLAINIPGTRDWEKWWVMVRFGYDIDESKINEMVYGLSYTKHCLTWSLYAKDNKVDDEVTVGLRFIINAYPDQVLAIGDPAISNPFGRSVPKSVWNKGK